MTAQQRNKLLAAVLLLATGGAIGFAVATWRGQPADQAAAATTASAPEGRKVLYWYDPMVPQHKFDKPGKSPFMDMQLVPKYADESPAGGVAVDPRLAQTLGWRTAVVEKQSTGATIDVPATVQLNERDVAIVQARTSGFVHQVPRRAVGDVVRAGAVIAEILVPEWAAAQQEYLAVKATADASLAGAARQRLVLLGMPPALVDQVERSGRVQPVLRITTPISGLLQELMVRPGMTVSAGMTLARINGLSSVWLEASLPEGQAWAARPGQPVEVRLSAFPGETALTGKVAAVLPEANAETRTLRVRIELPNPSGRLRAGMFAQVRFNGERKEALVVPGEAVIRTGQRALVYVVEPQGRFRPVEVRVGRELGDKLEILSGLQAGQQVVASGQFLIDSEASMQGLLQRQAAPAAAASAAGVASTAAAPAPLHEGSGRITALAGDEITLDHGPVPSLQWGAMEMGFKLQQPGIAQGFKVGDRVRFRFAQTDDGFEVRSLQREGGTQ